MEVLRCESTIAIRSRRNRFCANLNRSIYESWGRRPYDTRLLRFSGLVRHSPSPSWHLRPRSVSCWVYWCRAAGSKMLFIRHPKKVKSNCDHGSTRVVTNLIALLVFAGGYAPVPSGNFSAFAPRRCWPLAQTEFKLVGRNFSVVQTAGKVAELYSFLCGQS
jgi:hypothetical protein